jgi:diguanylate cyclase (GGDEF)-like protein
MNLSPELCNQIVMSYPHPILVFSMDSRLMLSNQAARDEAISSETGDDLREEFKWMPKAVKGFLTYNQSSYQFTISVKRSKSTDYYRVYLQKIGRQKEVVEVSLYKDVDHVLVQEHEKDHITLLKMVELLSDPAFTIDLDGRVTSWNNAMADFTQVQADEMVGKDRYEYALPFYGHRQPMLLDYVLHKEMLPPEKYNSIRPEDGLTTAEISLNTLRSAGIHILSRATILYGSQNQPIGAIEIMQDITDQRRTQEEISYLSTHDPITGLYNRIYFDTELERLKSSRRYPVSVLICSIPNQPTIHGRYTFPAEEEAIKNTSALIKSCFRREDVVARLDDDRFGILMPSTDPGIGKKALTRVKQACIRFNQTTDKNPQIDLSIGLATATMPNTLSQALRRAGTHQI